MRIYILFLLLAVFIAGCDGCFGNNNEAAVSPVANVPNTVPTPEATFGSMTPGSTAMQSERFKTHGTLGSFSGQIIEKSDLRSTAVKTSP